MGTTRIELREETKNKKGLCLLRLVYSIKGKRIYYTINEQLRVENWDKKNQQAVFVNKKQAKKIMPDVDFDILPSESKITEINSKFLNLKKTIGSIEKNFEFEGKPYSKEDVINKLKERQNPDVIEAEKPNQDLYEFIDRYIITRSNTRKEGSLQVYRTLKKHLLAFQQKENIQLTFSNLDSHFFDEFENFLASKTDKPLFNITIAKQLSTLKTFIGYAKKSGISISDSYKDKKITREEPEVIALTNDEFEAIYNYDLSENKFLEDAKIYLCLACTTGLRYSDLKNLKWVNIKKNSIVLDVIKTQEKKLTIPLNPYSKAILEKRKGKITPLPEISNSKINVKIKKLCELAGITEEIEKVRHRGNKRVSIITPKWKCISMHSGRRTFVTLSLQRGMKAEEVMANTGHTDYKSFKRYVKITEQHKVAAMAKAWGEIKSDLKAV